MSSESWLPSTRSHGTCAGVRPHTCTVWWRPVLSVVEVDQEEPNCWSQAKHGHWPNRPDFWLSLFCSSGERITWGTFCVLFQQWDRSRIPGYDECDTVSLLLYTHTGILSKFRFNSYCAETYPPPTTVDKSRAFWQLMCLFTGTGSPSAPTHPAPPCPDSSALQRGHSCLAPGEGLSSTSWCSTPANPSCRGCFCSRGGKHDSTLRS